MSLESARQSIVAAVEAAKTGFVAYPLVINYDNRMLVDPQTQTNPYLDVEIFYMSGEQADLSANPRHRVWGQLHLQAVVKEGQGRAKADALLDYFYPQLHRKTFGGVRTFMSSIAPVKFKNGLAFYPVLIPFMFDTIY